MSTWNGNKFSIYKTDEKQVLKLIQELATITNMNTDEMLRINNDITRLFTEILPENVRIVLNDWYENGQLHDIINEALLTGKVNVTDFNQYKLIQTDLISMLDSKFGYGTPEMYGAVGDGITDDTIAIQTCLNNHKITKLMAKTYIVNTTVYLPQFHSIEGNSGTLQASAIWIPSNLGPSIPSKAILWIKGREPVQGSDITTATAKVQDLKVLGVPINNNIGIYMGTVDRDLVNQVTNVNHSVFNFLMDNIFIAHCYNGLEIVDVWGTSFNKVHSGYASNIGCYIHGQMVNNMFTDCNFSAVDGNYALYVDGNTYSAEMRRPEGCSFKGCFIGYSKNGIKFFRGLSFHFSDCIIDLNTDYAVFVTDGSHLTFSSCWLQSNLQAVVALEAFGSFDNTSEVNFNACKFVSTGLNNALFVGSRQSGIVLNGCYLNSKIVFDDYSYGQVHNCLWNVPVATDNLLSQGVGSFIASSHNYHKTTMAVISVNDVI